MEIRMPATNRVGAPPVDISTTGPTRSALLPIKNISPPDE